MKRIGVLLLTLALAVGLLGCDPGSGYGKYAELYLLLEAGDYEGAHKIIDKMAGVTVTTVPPTTKAPTVPTTTVPPTTEAPTVSTTTVPPTTESPTVPTTTVPPTTEAPTVPTTTVPPTTEAPTVPTTTVLPTTEAPTVPTTTVPPTTEAPTVPITTVPPTMAEPTVPTTVAPTTAPDVGAGFTILEFPYTIGRNQTATVTIQAAPNTEYSIKVYYSSGPSKAAGLENKTSDGTGLVSWSWKIGGKTAPGTYRIEISGGGQSQEYSFTVEAV